MITWQDVVDMGYEEVEETFTVDPLTYSRIFSKVTNQEPKRHLYAALIKEEFDEWKSSHLHDDKLNEIKELCDLLYVIYGYAYACGWDITEALQRVHKNNIDRVVQDDGSIKRREDGKIIKNPNAPKVDLRDILNRTLRESGDSR